MTTIYCEGASDRCDHIWSSALGYGESLGDGRNLEHTYVGNNGDATCVCCAKAGFPVPMRGERQCDPIPCDHSMQRCRDCFMTGGAHTAICRSHPEGMVRMAPRRSDAFLAA